MFNCCSHGTLLHFSLQSSRLNICYYHQDLHPWRLHARLRGTLQCSPQRPSYSPRRTALGHALPRRSGIGLTLERHPFSGLVDSAGELLHELVLKNLYILTTNISGLKVGGNVGELWSNHEDLARAVANDVLDIQFKLINQELDREALIQSMVTAFQGDLQHKCMGRSAPARLERALSQAKEFGLDIPNLKDIEVSV